MSNDDAFSSEPHEQWACSGSVWPTTANCIGINGKKIDMNWKKKKKTKIQSINLFAVQTSTKIEYEITEKEMGNAVPPHMLMHEKIEASHGSEKTRTSDAKDRCNKRQRRRSTIDDGRQTGDRRSTTMQYGGENWYTRRLERDGQGIFFSFYAKQATQLQKTKIWMTHIYTTNILVCGTCVVCVCVSSSTTKIVKMIIVEMNMKKK